MKTYNSGLGTSGTGTPSLENNVYESIVSDIQRDLLTSELEQNGIKFTKEDIVFIAKDKTGKTVFLEKGNTSAGLQHILDRHEKDFINKGLKREDIPKVIMKALTSGTNTGRVQGRSPGRPIYEVEYNGTVYDIAITVGSNGFIVGANPAS